MPTPSERWWSFVSPVYDRAVGLVGWHGWQDALVADVTTGVVLDLGCGPAHVGRGLLRRGVDYVGVDQSGAMLARAEHTLRGCGPGRVHLVRADVHALPFADGSFDVVLSTGVLGLLDRSSRRTVLSEVARVSRGQVRLLEPVARDDERLSRMRWRVLAFVRDEPLRLAELRAAGLSPGEPGRSVLGGVYSPVVASRTPSPE